MTYLSEHLSAGFMQPDPEDVLQRQKYALHGCPMRSKGGNIWSNFASVGNGLFDNFMADE